MRRIGLAAALFIAAAAVIGALFAVRRSSGPDRPAAGPYRGSEPPGEIRMAEFELSDETGRRVASRNLRGKVVLLSFLDSQCTDSCPVIAFQVARTLDSLPGEVRRQVVALAISTDPDEDTPASVRRFLSSQRALGRLRYLGADEPVATLRPIWRHFHVLSSFESGKDTLHSASVRVFDRQGLWVSTLHPAVDLTRLNLAHDIRVAARS